MKLDEIAYCSTGAVLSRYEGSTPYRLISAKYIDDLGRITDTEEFSGDGIPEISKTCTDDIIIKIAFPNNAVYITEEYSGAVVSSFFFVVRLNSHGSQLYDPRFLAVYFNSPNFKKYVEKSLISSTVKSLKISYLKDADIPEIPLQKQNEIINIAEAMLKEELALRELRSKQQKYYEQVLYELMGENGI